jgi:hypothetical protein
MIPKRASIGVNMQPGRELLTIDGVEVEVRRDDPAVLELRHGPDLEPLGALELTGDGTAFVARTPRGDLLTQASPWGGPITARFRTRELGARALLAERRRAGTH